MRVGLGSRTQYGLPLPIGTAVVLSLGESSPIALHPAHCSMQARIAPHVPLAAKPLAIWHGEAAAFEALSQSQSAAEECSSLPTGGKAACHIPILRISV